MPNAVKAIDVILFAGGYAGSMRPITEFMPKALLPLGNKPLILRIIEDLSNMPVNHVFIFANHFRELLSQYVDLIVSAKVIDKAPTIIDVSLGRWGTGGMLSILKGKTCDDVLMYYCDVVPMGLNYQSFLQMHLEGRQSNIMGTLAVSNRYKLDTGYVEVDKGGNVTRFNEKPECDEKLKHMGISLFTSEIFELIRKSDENLYPDVVGTAIQMGRKMQCYVHEGQWHHFQHISKYHFEHVVNYDKWIY